MVPGTVVDISTLRFFRLELGRVASCDARIGESVTEGCGAAPPVFLLQIFAPVPVLGGEAHTRWTCARAGPLGILAEGLHLAGAQSRERKVAILGCPDSSRPMA
ncbi:hypothetical protein GCM10009867_12430 [Pedococcus aerophilus]|uniref:Uncharacterized protein n=1 Tax=Pedococcus aerophilus TaxID=436356 RepID=A0ABN3UJ55_9MICO